MYHKITTLFILFLVILAPIKLIAQNTEQTLVLSKEKSDKTREIDFGKRIRMKTTQGEIHKGELQNGNQEYIIINTDTILIEEIEWLNQRVLMKPLAITVFTFGTTVLAFGTAAWASSVGSDDVWAQLGAVVGALFALGGVIIDLATLPVLLKGRKYRLQGKNAHWKLTVAP